MESLRGQETSRSSAHEDQAKDPRSTEGAVVKRFWKRLWCLHYWNPITDLFWGAHSDWDCITGTRRMYQCAKCGKKSTYRCQPVNYIEHQP